MQFDAPDLAFRREAIEFFQRESRPEWLILDPNSQAYLDLARALDDRLIERGWYTLHWPTEFGGAGAGFIRYGILRELEGYVRRPVYGTTHARYIVGPALMNFGTPSQQQEFLPRMAAGHMVVALGYTEAGAGSDLAAMTTTAIRDDHGYVINGAKRFITYGHYADAILLAARTELDAPRHKGISLFLVDLSLPGVRIEPMMAITGQQVNEIVFEDVRISGDRLLGVPGRGFYHMAVALNFERCRVDRPATYAADLEDIALFCRESGRWDDPDVRALIGRLSVSLEAWRRICWRVMAMQARGDVPSWHASLDQLLRKKVNPEFGRLILEVFGSAALLEAGPGSSPLTRRLEYLLRESFNNHGQGGIMVTRNSIGRRGLDLPRLTTSESPSTVS